jgi:hypothetical protein
MKCVVHSPQHTPHVCMCVQLRPYILRPIIFIQKTLHISHGKTPTHPDETRAANNRALLGHQRTRHGRGLDPVVDLVHVHEVAKREIAWAIDAGNGRLEGHGADRKDEVIVFFLVSCILGVVLHCDFLGGAIDGNNLR